MAVYAAYRHIELDNVGCGKKSMDPVASETEIPAVGEEENKSDEDAQEEESQPQVVNDNAEEATYEATPEEDTKVEIPDEQVESVVSLVESLKLEKEAGEEDGEGSDSAMKPPGGESHDLFGAEFRGTPCHHRVLKPPGGGSSDIFGAPDPLLNSPRRSRNNLQLQSSVFGPSQSQQFQPQPQPQQAPAAAINGEAAASARSKPGNDSYARLFGPANLRPASAPKDRLKSNIVLSSTEATGPKGRSPVSPGKQNGEIAPETPSTPRVSMPRRNPVTGDGMYVQEYRRSGRRRDGNPVTGEGYTNGGQPAAPPAASPANSVGSQAPTPVSATNGGPTHSAPPQRTRVPPGGFSSGLW